MEKICLIYMAKKIGKGFNFYRCLNENSIWLDKSLDRVVRKILIVQTCLQTF